MEIVRFFLYTDDIHKPLQERQLVIQKTVTRTILILLSFPLLLAACGGETAVEPTPILPPPNLAVDGTDSGAAGVIEADSTPLVENPVTPVPTPTLVPTATFVPTQLPVPVTDPPLQAVTSGSMPATSRDLLFLADGAFKRWNHETQSIDILVPGAEPSSRIRTDENQYDDFVGDITDFSVNADGKRAVFSRLTFSQPVTRTNSVGEETLEYPDRETQHEMYFMDLVSRETWLLVPRVDNLGHFSLSRDAQHVAFAGSSLNGASVLAEDGRPIPNMYFLPTGGGNPGTVVQVAQCRTFCSQIAWHQENNLFVYGDDDALWMQNLAAQTPEILIQNSPFNPTGASTDIAVYTPISWAQNGRFLLLWKGGWEGGSRAVFDIPTQALVEVPDSFQYIEAFPAEIMWMPDDRLYVLRTEGSGSFIPQIELWRFQPEQNTVVKEESRVLSDQQVGAKGQQYLENGRFAYALMSDQDLNPASGLFHLTSLTEEPERVNAVPTVSFFPGGAGEVSWPTDGSGALIFMRDSGNRVYYGPASGGALYDITAMLGAEPHAFHWQPEIVIP